MKSANFVNFKDISMKTEISRETCPIDQQWQDLRTSHDFFSIGAHDAYLTATQSSLSNTLDHLYPKNSFRWRPQLNLDLDYLQYRYFETNCAQVTNMDTLVCLSSEDIFKFQTKRDSPAVEKTLIQIYIKSELGADAEALKIAFDYIEGNLAEGDTKKIDSFLGKFQPERVKRIVSVGVVRSTFRARTILAEWNHCFARVAKTLNENNQSPHKYLRGLYPTNGQRLLAKRRAV